MYFSLKLEINTKIFDFAPLTPYPGGFALDFTGHCSQSPILALPVLCTPGVANGFLCLVDQMVGYIVMEYQLPGVFASYSCQKCHDTGNKLHL